MPRRHHQGRPGPPGRLRQGQPRGARRRRRPGGGHRRARQLSPVNEANTDGNARFYGFECENLGDGEDPWTSAQLDAIERVSAAVCRVHGWNQQSVIGHLEWQPGKIDPRGFTMKSMRERIKGRLK
ncbi:N-acetylmuramoyl-L-alanine amidase [Actinomadura keratinilytica]